MSETLGAAILGCGGIGTAHAWAVTRVPNVRMVACVDAIPDRAEAFARRFGGDAYTDPARALERSDVDFVLVTTANDLHAPLTIQALEAGKHVLVQKPMALNLEQCDAMITTAQRSGKKLMVSFFEFFHPAFARAKELIDAGVIGRVFMMKAIMAWHIPNTDAWRFNPAISGGGILMDGHSHHIALFHWLVGEPVTRVFSEGGTLASDARVEDTAVTLLRTPGAIAEISGSMRLKEPCPQNGRYFKESIEIFGTEGTIHIKPEERPSLRVFSDNGKIADPLNGWVSPTLDWIPYEDRGRSMHFNGDEDPWVPEHKYFVDCIQENREPMSDGKFGREVMELIFAGYESMRQGRSIKLPLEVAAGVGYQDVAR